MYGELLIGDKAGRRKQLLADYEQMHQAPVVSHRDVVEFVRDRRLHGRDIGWIGAASVGVGARGASETVDDGSGVGNGSEGVGDRLRVGLCLGPPLNSVSKMAAMPN